MGVHLLPSFVTWRRKMESANSNIGEWSVSDLAQRLKRLVEGEFGHVRVKGEISRFTRAASGHCYWTLKDENAVMDAVMWKGTASRLSFKPEEGLEVICTGKITTYPARSRYQIVVEAMEPAGEGALMAMLEARKKALAAEGLFAQERKQSIPHLPKVIGVVTSPTGAVIRDILHRLADRFPRHVLVAPVKVQGEGAAEEIAAAIQKFNAGGDFPRPDLLIVARGGGSLEDLWAFNEEVVVRAAAASEIPLISAVGHETDTTLIDYASDMRAPTPTAAAELAVPVRAELLSDVQRLEARRLAAMSRLLEQRRERLKGLARGLPKPEAMIKERTQRLDHLSARLPMGLRAGVQERQARLARLTGALRPRQLQGLAAQAQDRLAGLGARLGPAFGRGVETQHRRLQTAQKMLKAYSYQGVLDRGFALVTGGDGKPVRSRSDTWPGLDVSIEFSDGAVGATIEKGKAPRKKKAKKEPDEQQGSLL